MNYIGLMWYIWKPLHFETSIIHEKLIHSLTILHNEGKMLRLRGNKHFWIFLLGSVARNRSRSTAGAGDDESNWASDAPTLKISSTSENRNIFLPRKYNFSIFFCGDLSGKSVEISLQGHVVLNTRNLTESFCQKRGENKGFLRRVMDRRVFHCSKSHTGKNWLCPCNEERFLCSSDALEKIILIEKIIWLRRAIASSVSIHQTAMHACQATGNFKQRLLIDQPAVRISLGSSPRSIGPSDHLLALEYKKKKEKRKTTPCLIRNAKENNAHQCIRLIF